MGWTFTPDEFTHVWQETDLDRVPFPLRLLAAARTEDEARARQAELDHRLPRNGDPDLTACLRILARPQARIIMIGGAHAPGSELRLLACAVYDRAVLVRQEPGDRADFGGRIQLSIGHTAKIGARIAACLPNTPAGREPAREADATAVRDDEQVVASDPAAPRIRRLLHRPHTGEGHLRIETGLDRHRPAAPMHYSWIDVAGDGRYLLKAADVVHVVPASRDQLAQHLQRRIGN